MSECNHPTLLYPSHPRCTTAHTQPQIRHIYSLLTTTTTGAAILRDYHQTKKDALLAPYPLSAPINSLIAASTRSRLRRCSYGHPPPHLHTTIHIYTYDIDHKPVKISFSPYPTPHYPEPFLPTPTPHISILATYNHFQLLLPYKIGFLSITSNLIPLPKAPNITTTPNGNPTSITAPFPIPHKPRCPYHSPRHPNSPPAFCPPSCHLHCPNQHSAFKTIPQHIIPPLHDGSHDGEKVV